MTLRNFPVTAVLAADRSREIISVVFPGGELRLCCHGARELARMLVEVADTGYCDGYRHGGNETMFDGFKVHR